MITALHERASDWYAEHGQPDEALRYALRAKDYARAVQVISRYRHRLWTFYVPYLTYTKVYLAVGTPESLARAEAMLERLYAHAERQHNPRVLIEVLAQQALLADVRHDQRTALMLLERALMLAEPQNHIRLFADHGSRMAVLLSHVHSRSVAPKYIKRTLEAFDTERSRDPFPTQDRLIEPLTNRELEVLELLHRRMRNKEIADSLYISPGTVKRHVNAIN